ncbi:MAG: pseudouridine synthase [Eubacteriales bacterium]|jgi:23S rRNA pseudouridine2605 synthase|nr:pseudouridine synthase [Eubacteriales bacterium]
MNTREDEIRIQKYMSDSGIMSRRKTEEEIRAGNITVNGQTAVLGQKVKPGIDRVEYNGRSIKPAESRRMYIMLNKPVGYITSLSDDRGRPCVAALVRDAGTRVYPCGRLDMDSEGLLLLTNDGDMANKLTHPGHNIAKIYHVTLTTEITPEQLHNLGQPMIIDDYTIAPVNTSIVTQKKGLTVLRMELYEGRNRQIRKMCELCGLTITRLRRISVGALSLGGLKPGQWRRLNAGEIKYLKGIE